jgi:hypothetical protein
MAFAPSRNLQREDGAALIDKRSDLQRPVVGYDYVQKDQRWVVPDPWMCFGVEVDRTYFYEKDIKPGMADEACAKAGAYSFRPGTIDDWGLHEDVFQEGHFGEGCGQPQSLMCRAHGRVLLTGR